MKNKKMLSLVLVISLYLLLPSCSPKTQVTTQEQETIFSSQTEQPSQPATSKWDKLISLAKKERKISLYSVADGELRVALIKAMREKFRLELDMITGRAAELTPRLFNERKAGIYTVDVYMGGGGTLINDLKPAGIFEPLEPQLILLEVLDVRAWWEGKLPWHDRDKQVFAFLTNPSTSLTINVKMVREEEIKSYRDLLNPK